MPPPLLPRHRDLPRFASGPARTRLRPGAARPLPPPPRSAGGTTTADLAGRLLLEGGSSPLGAEPRRRRRRSFGISLAAQGGMVLAMLLLPAPPPPRPLAPSRQWDMVANLVLVAPRRAARRRVLVARRPTVPPPVLAHRRVVAAAPQPLALSPAPTPMPALAAAAPLPHPAPAPVPAPQPQPKLGSFGSPTGLEPHAGVPVAVAELGRFGTDGLAPAAVPSEPGGDVRDAGFGASAADGDTETAAGSTLGRVQASGFAAGAAGPAAGPGGAGSGVVLHQFGGAPTAALDLGPESPPPPAEFEAPEVLAWPAPAYTAAAAQRHIEGEVVLEVQLGATGAVQVLRVVQGLGYGLDEAAAAAARHLQYRPARRRGQAVDWTVFLHINFRLAY